MAGLNVSGAAAADGVTIVRSAGPVLAKRWNADGTTTASDNAWQMRPEERSVRTLDDMHALLKELDGDPQAAIVRGQFVGHDRAAGLLPGIVERHNAGRARNGKGPVSLRAGFVPRVGELFEDVPRRWLMLDVDGYTPGLYIATEEPGEAAAEFVADKLPEVFRGRSFVYQCSGSAGHSTAGDKLKAHLWFLLDGAGFTSAELKAWADDIEGVDAVVFSPVQLHYTAAPVLAPGLVDPMAGRRVGLHRGPLGDTVPLVIDPATRDRARAAGGRRREMADPREKPGYVGAYCDAVECSTLADRHPDLFSAGRSDVHFTWAGGSGAVDGVRVTDDGLHLLSSHSTAPVEQGRAYNAYDWDRLFQFGHLDDDDGAGDCPMRDRPSVRAMNRWIAENMPEVAAAARAAMTSTAEDDFAGFDEPATTGAGADAGPPSSKDKPRAGDASRAGAGRLTADAVITKLRAMGDAQVAAAWPGLVVGLPPDQQEQVLDVVDRVLSVGPRALRATLRQEERQQRARQRRDEFEARAEGRALIAFRPEAQTEQARQVEALIIASAKPGEWVQYGDVLSRVALKPLPHTHGAGADGEGTPAPTPQLEPLDRVAVLGQVERVAVFFEERQQGPATIAVPPQVLEVLLEQTQRAAPRVAGLLTHPVVLPDSGEILATDGLHPATGLYLSGASVAGCRPYNQAEARIAYIEARETLLEGFDFATPLDADVAMAGALTGLQRCMMDSAPGLAIMANSQSSGKTTLARRLHILLTGQDLSITTLPQGDESETRKTLLAQLMRAPQMICFDNIADGATVRSSILAAVMTSPLLRQRLLGRSQEVEVPTTSFFVLTGNNLLLGVDEATRWLCTRLVSRTARPDSRQHRHPDVLAHALATRPQVLRDMIGIVAGFARYGAPMPTASRFAQWERSVRQPILWAGGEDVAQTFKDNQVQAPESLAHNQVVDALHRAFGGRRFSASEVADLAVGRVAGGLDDAPVVGGAPAPDELEGLEIRTALREGLHGRGVKDYGDPVQVGRVLRGIVDRVALIGEEAAPWAAQLISKTVRGSVRYEVQRAGGAG